ncbi:MAG TPA: bifunctional aspartate kinase/homoserine dehydrogenase I [Chitinophagaceae bacterium]|nr:bifunctional aspartate kinase/homoserine dehydrogenase I [Chitinophagaceae bacterium]
MKVLKFGGTSVGGVEPVRTIVGVVREMEDRGERVALVISAMGGVTNDLLEMGSLAEEGKDFSPLLRQMESRHLELIQALLPVRKQNAAIMPLKIYFNELEELLDGVKAVGERSPRTRDHIAAYGELCSTLVISRILGQYYGCVRFQDSREWIHTDSNFGNARVDFDKTNLRIRGAVHAVPEALWCVTGYIASNEKGQTTTLGRGGSDYTAAILGAALDSEQIQIWTDVNGFMTADPKMVRRAISLTEISYTEAMELSYFGARVIYPPTMIPVFLKKVPVLVKNTFNPDFPGTVIRDKTLTNGSLIRGISSINEVTLVNVEGGGMIGKTGFSGRLFSLLAREGINIILITQASSEHSITFAVSPGDAARARILIEKEFELELLTQKIERPTLEQDLALMAVVGEHMKKTHGLSGKLFSALGRNGVNVAAIAQGSSEFNISVAIQRKDLSKALNAVHDAFFIHAQKTLHIFYLGVGHIGRTLLAQIHSHEEALLRNNSLRLRVMGITNTRKMIFSEDGIPLSNWQEALQAGGETAGLGDFVRRMKAMNLPNSVFIDNSASPEVVQWYEEIFRANISVVTCNKIGNSGSYDQYRRFREAVRKYGVDFFYETNVGAGLPIISTLRDLLVSGDRIIRIEAILSGTISYIFNHFTGDASFHDVVRQAQQLGYTEPDPRDDLSGRDFMRKMLILARDSGYPLEPEEVVIEQILPPSCLEAESIGDFYRELHRSESHFGRLKEQAVAKGKVLRFIGCLDQGAVTIGLKEVDASHPFYSLSGSDNIISFTTERYSNCPLVIKGPGAGAEVTAAGVFADLVKVGAVGYQ